MVRHRTALGGGRVHNLLPLDHRTAAVAGHDSDAPCVPRPRPLPGDRVHRRCPAKGCPARGPSRRRAAEPRARRAAAPDQPAAVCLHQRKASVRHRDSHQRPAAAAWLCPVPHPSPRPGMAGGTQRSAPSRDRAPSLPVPHPPLHAAQRPGRLELTRRHWDQPSCFPTIGCMPSYEPVDLSAACNAGVEVLGDEPGDVPLGRVNLRGLPFLIGSEPPSAERCLLLPGATTSVGIGRLARRVIVAHRLLEPGAPAGHAVGQAVAEYAFHLAGGEVVVASIRERFEIQVAPPGWGRLPFLAVTDTSDYKLPRFEGKWDEAGFRLVEHAMGWPAGYYLWCWENPDPERAVERIEVIPRGSRFVVAGITTSDVDEHPFVRAPARPVRLVAKDA